LFNILRDLGSYQNFDLGILRIKWYFFNIMISILTDMLLRILFNVPRLPG
jgi:hypothetical protein